MKSFFFNKKILLFYSFYSCSFFSINQVLYSKETPSVKATEIFISGKKHTTGYDTFRIPAIIQTSPYHLIAFAEGRVNHAGDAGNIDIVCRRSSDGGKTWSPLQIVFDDLENTCRNPSPVFDHQTGLLFLLTTWSNAHESAIMNGQGICKIFIQFSKDHGETWSEPQEITSQVKKNNWQWYATGPGSAIQIQQGPFKNRLIVPANHSEITEQGEKIYYSHCFFSDDYGKTWQLGTSAEQGSNESMITETQPGILLQNMRQQQFNQGKRTQRYSSDGGKTWTILEHCQDLFCGICQGSIIQDPHSKILYFSNPSHPGRYQMTIYRSLNNGKNWEKGPVIWKRRAGYSNLISLNEKEIGILFECGEKNITEKIIFLKITIDDIFPPHKNKEENND